MLLRSKINIIYQYILAHLIEDRIKINADNFNKCLHYLLGFSNLTKKGFVRLKMAILKALRDFSEKLSFEYDIIIIFITLCKIWGKIVNTVSSIRDKKQLEAMKSFLKGK